MSKVLKFGIVVFLLFGCVKEDVNPEALLLGSWVLDGTDLVLDDKVYQISQNAVIQYSGNEIFQFSKDSTFQKIVDNQLFGFGRWKYFPVSKNVVLKYSANENEEIVNVFKISNDSLILATLKLRTLNPIIEESQNQIVNKAYYLMVGYDKIDKPNSWTRIVIRQKYKRINE